MRVGWLAIILGVFLVSGCSRTTNIDKRDGGAAPNQEGGVGGRGDAAGAGRGDGSAGSGAYSGGGGGVSSGGSGGGSMGGTGGGTSGTGETGGGIGGIDAGLADAYPADTGPGGPLAAFCTGALAHMVVNGIDSGPAVLGTVLPLNCCEAAEFTVMTQTFAQVIVVWWEAQVGAATAFPATIDLANPPQGWTVRVDVGCDPMQGNYCNPAPDSYTTGLQGTLQVARSSTGYDMTLCLSVAESPGSPHPIVHSLQLYAPQVAATY